MSREILFRGKWIENSEWVEGYYYKTSEKTYRFKGNYERKPVPEHHYILQRLTGWRLPNQMAQFEIDPKTVCQYTGLTDKNGKKIWENDILSAHWDDDYPEDVAFCKVVWEENGFKTIESDSVDSAYLLKVDCDEYYEAIGNIFDNPELLCN